MIGQTKQKAFVSDYQEVLTISKRRKGIARSLFITPDTDILHHELTSRSKLSKINQSPKILNS